MAGEIFFKSGSKSSITTQTPLTPSYKAGTVYFAVDNTDNGFIYFDYDNKRIPMTEVASKDSANNTIVNFYIHSISSSNNTLTYKNGNGDQLGTANIINSISNAWTGGTTAGPTLKTTVNGVSSTAVAIPSASASASGVVTTGAQTFAGSKTFSSKIIGDLQGNADTATKATKDNSNNVIDSTYIKTISYSGNSSTNAAGTSITAGSAGLVTMTKGDGTINKIDIPAATASIAGLVNNGAQTYAGTKTFSTGITITSGTSTKAVFNYSDIQAGTSNAARPVWFAWAGQNGTPVIDTNFTYNPSTGTLKATNFDGLATKATGDSNGNNILATYASSLSLSGNTLTLKNKNGDTLNTVTIATSDTKVNVTLGTTTKAYVLGTTTTPTGTATGVTSIADTGVYLGTTAGELVATKFTGDLSGNATSATSATKATNDSANHKIIDYYVHEISISNNTLNYKDGDGDQLGTANIINSISNTWTAGTSAGPTLKTTVNGVSGTAVAIPSASISASGIVTTGAQTFAGSKTFDSKIIGNLQGNADTATKATQDSNGNNILSTYANSLTASGTTLTLKNKNGDVLSTVTTQDTKNTAGSTQNTNKLYLIGATSQAANPQTYSSSKVYVTDGVVTATTFSGNLSGNATTATTATTATKDSGGNNIESTYIKSLSISGTTITVTKGDNTTSTLSTQDTKNTAGSTQSTSKLFLIGATSQAANPQTYSSSKVYVTDNTVTAPIFSGDLSGNASTATKATQDGGGNNIESTYIKSLSVSGTTLTIIKGDNTTSTIILQDNNTDTKVNVKARGTTKAYLLGTTTSPTSSNQAVESVAETGVYFDTTAAKLVATTFKGALEGNASTATKATQDGGGNNIESTYIKNIAITDSSAKIQLTKGDGTTLKINAEWLPLTGGTVTGATQINRNIFTNITSVPEQGETVLTALGYKTGYPVYTDPLFTSGYNDINRYNNNHSSAPYTAIERMTYTTAGITNPGTGSDYVIRIQNTGSGTSPGLGGFVQTISSRANAVFIQIFRALIPTGYTLATASNAMGSNYSDVWLTDPKGTGKWEWYARRVLCGKDGTFSSGGHVYLSGTAGTSSAPVNWYLSYCNLYDLTKAQYDGLRTRYADNATLATKATGDSNGNNILNYYAHSLTSSGNTLTLKNGNGDQLGTASIINSVSNTWTAGTTAGPTLKTTVNGVTGTAVAIPSASASASGVVTTGAQTFAGTKTFANNVVIAKSSGAPDPASTPVTYANRDSFSSLTFNTNGQYGSFIMTEYDSAFKPGVNLFFRSDTGHANIIASYLKAEDGLYAQYANTLITGGTYTAAVTTSPYVPVKWTFNTTINPLNGDIITIETPGPGHDYGVFLSISNGDYYPVVLSGTGRLTTHYPQGTLLTLIFDSDQSAASIFPLAGATARTTVTGGAWRVINYYDSGNPGDWNLRQYTIKAAAALTAVHVIGGTDSGYKNIDAGNAFDIRYAVMYAGSDIAAAGTGSNNFIHHYSVNLRNSSNSNITLTAYKNIYIKGTIAGNTFTPYSTTNPYVQDITAADDGYVYYYIGRAYSTTAMTFDTTGRDIFVYKNGAIRKYSGNAENANYVNLYEARNVTTDLNKAANYVGAGTMFHLVASASTTTGKTPTDANILQMNWDNNGGYDSQFGISTSGSRGYIRSQVSAGTAWRELVTIAAGTATGSGVKPVYISGTGAVTASSSSVGSTYVPVYLNSGTITVCTSPSILINLASTSATNVFAASPRPGVTGVLGVANGGTGCSSWTANKLVYSSATTTLESTGGLSYFTGNSTASTPATYTRLHINGTTYGNTAANMISGTAGLFSFGDGGPQITFDSNATPGGSQAGALIYTDHDTAATGVSWHFVSNQSDWNVTSKRFHARTSISIGSNLPVTSYNLYVTGTAYITGSLYKNSTGVSWVNGRNGAIVRNTYTKYTSNQYNPLWSVKSINGTWDCGTYTTNNSLYFTYITDDNFDAGTNATTAQVEFRGNDNSVRASKVYGAVWNDYAEYRIVSTKEPGRCVTEIGDDTLELSTQRLQPGCEIISDTYGFAIGETEQAKTPIATTGRVLAYPYENREEFKKHIGEPVCSGPNGTVSIMAEEEWQKYPHCIIGTISAIPDYEEWGTEKIKVNGRIWIRIR